MNGKRERLQIIHDILVTIQKNDGKVKPTHILYKANLSHQMLDEYLDELISKEFIVEKKIKSLKTYSLSDKGFKFLEKYGLITEFVDSFGLN